MFVYVLDRAFEVYAGLFPANSAAYHTFTVHGYPQSAHRLQHTMSSDKKSPAKPSAAKKADKNPSYLQMIEVGHATCEW